jgi:stage II sporulation protein D
VAGEPRLEVALAWDLDSTTVVPLNAVTVSEAPLPAGMPLVARVQHGAVVLGQRSGRRFETLVTGAAAETLWIGLPDSDARLGAPGFLWHGKTWRGRAKLFVNPRGRLTIATRVPVETYLVGVVPGEIGPLADALIEAGRAQAIAARSFTLYYRGRRGLEGFDLFGTVEDQVYGPVENERPLATRCVESTRGMVALSDGQPIRANYSSTCGGITAEVWEAWPEGPRPYLVSHLDGGPGRDWCAASPHFRWHEEWSATMFLDDVKRFGPAFGVHLPARGVGTLKDVRVASRSVSGRVWRLNVVTTTGTIVIPAHTLRQVIRRPGNPNGILRSTLFKVDVRRDARRVLTVVVSGAGSGHGVGLCQTGALGMARAGQDGEKIIRHYYTGTDLKRLW